ncbi:MAG: hypothetical protein HDQ88_08800 [Clostridia bacterium]|nr:hypothetical protein [Clostridia bacterium]
MANGSTGWEQFATDVDLRKWISDNPDKSPTHVFRSGPQYQIDTIEQAQFNAICHAFGFEPEHYRHLACESKNEILEMYGFDRDKNACLFRNIQTNKVRTISPKQAYVLLNILTGV